MIVSCLSLSLSLQVLGSPVNRPVRYQSTFTSAHSHTLGQRSLPSPKRLLKTSYKSPARGKFSGKFGGFGGKMYNQTSPIRMVLPPANKNSPNNPNNPSNPSSPNRSRSRTLSPSLNLPNNPNNPGNIPGDVGGGGRVTSAHSSVPSGLKSPEMRARDARIDALEG